MFASGVKFAIKSGRPPASLFASDASAVRWLDVGVQCPACMFNGRTCIPGPPHAISGPTLSDLLQRSTAGVERRTPGTPSSSSAYAVGRTRVTDTWTAQRRSRTPGRHDPGPGRHASRAHTVVPRYRLGECL
ncbi:hypothetical protein BD414DRAFT_476004 [Trametes punicea]|nr:hypothetical protein BD414DRAFT_476004 [Trametes punicea]